MAEEVKECNVNNILFLEKPNIKEESKDNCCIDIFETAISANDTELKDNVWDNRLKEYKIATSIVDDMKIEPSSTEACNIVKNVVKIENEINTDDIKIEFDNNLLFCDHCKEHYEDYCTRCGMLAHILNGNILSMTYDRAIKGLPKDILEIRESIGRVGVFALKVIPEGIKVGPFNGLGTSECSRRLKGGKFIVPAAESKLLNWMQYINPARNIFQQNLIPFQHDDNLYYHSNREILISEELLVYFGEEYEDCVNKDFEMDFIAPADDDVKDVFACTLCCLGFSSRGYLAKHKSTCPNETKGKFSFDELTQCPSCNIYVYEKEYLECHRPYCGETNVRNCISVALDNQTVEVNRRKTRRLQMYECTQCKYKTSYKSVLRSHLNKHFEVKVYRCEVCFRQFKTKGSLKLHVKYKHIDVEGKVGQKVYRYSQDKVKTKHLKEFTFECEECNYKTKRKQHFETHIKSKHLKQFSYKCEICDYKTNHKPDLEKHVKSKHLKQFSFECNICDYKTNQKLNLEIHVKSIHLKEFSYECEKCDYKTNHKQHFGIHVKSKHLKQFSYECEICNYKTNEKQNFEVHVKSKHLKEFNYECEICDYKTNYKPLFKNHIKSIHLKEFSFECELCDYKSNLKSKLENHINTKHLKQFSYECEMCDYKSNHKQHFETHVKSKHLKQFSYQCETCDYKTNQKLNFEVHVKSIHLKQFNYECDKCNYKTNRKLDLKIHIKSKHLQEFNYECENCDYKTNQKSNIEEHVKSKHLKQFKQSSYVCEMCDYKTYHKPHFARHVKSKHLKQFSYKCEICDYKTNYKQNFEIHVKSKHLKEFSYKCEICDFQTNYKSYFQTHLKSKHLKEFSYKCEVCVYETNEKSKLRKHVKSKHLKQFSYECEKCDYKTNQKSNLETHVKAKHLKKRI